MLHEEHAPERHLLVITQSEEFLDALPLGLIGPSGLLGIRYRPLLDLFLRRHHRRGSAPLGGALHLGRQCLDIHRRRKLADFFLSAIRVGHHQLRGLSQDRPATGRCRSFIDAGVVAVVVGLPLTNQKAVVGKIPQPRRQIFSESRVRERCGDIEPSIWILVGDLRWAEGFVHTVFIGILRSVFFPIEGTVDRGIEGRADLLVCRPRFAQRIGDGMPCRARCGPGLEGAKRGLVIIRVAPRPIGLVCDGKQLFIQEWQDDLDLIDLLASVDERRDFLRCIGEADHGAAVERVEGQRARLALPFLFTPDRIRTTPLLGDETRVVPCASCPVLRQGDRLVPVAAEHTHPHRLGSVDR